MIIKAGNKQLITVICSVIMLSLMLIAYSLGVNVQYIFCISIICVYLLMIPKTILNPKNFVFGFYFMWYGVAPLFASRYDNLEEYGSRVNDAFMMCFVTYVFIMITLDLRTDDRILCNRTNEYKSPIVLQSKIEKMVTIGILFMGFIPYVVRTGGLSLWLTDADAGFFSRRGNGVFYLMFSLSLMVIVFFEGQRAFCAKSKSKKVRIYIVQFLTIVVLYRFIGSKVVVLQLFLLLFFDFLLKQKLFSKTTCAVIIIGIAIFLYGLYTRSNGNILFVKNYALNYFNTFENFLIAIDDFTPGFMTTFMMPFMWPFIKLGILPSDTMFDFNVYLTTIYSPDSYYIGQGSDQWNIEMDMYLNFFFVLGIPLVILLFNIIAKLYENAIRKGGVWKFIYLYEAVSIISHLRGGIIYYWYWYLIPLYVYLVYKYRRKKVENRQFSIDGIYQIANGNTSQNTGVIGDYNHG